jgi:hypothetical protein
VRRLDAALNRRKRRQAGALQGLRQRTLELAAERLRLNFRDREVAPTLGELRGMKFFYGGYGRDPRSVPRGPWSDGVIGMLNG